MIIKTFWESVYLLTAMFSSFFSPSVIEIQKYAPVVQTESGKVRGIIVDAGKNDQQVYLYQGIKYGQAERFRKPTPAPSWSGIYDATSIKYACPQPNVPHFSNKNSQNDKKLYSSEDCLYLNVYRPEAKGVPEVKRAVMVWIHGGTFISGSSFDPDFDGKFIASLGDVVLVTLNYRLGALGFALGDDETKHPGNLGLYDIELALKWVKENVAHFDGNPNSVTIFGESAGSMSVGSVILSPMTPNNLFERAILQSGAPNSFIGSQSRETNYFKVKTLAESLGCPNSNLTEIMQCLKEKPVVELQNGVNNLEKLLMYFGPTYETEFLPENPVKMLKSGNFNSSLDLLFGVNRDEGASNFYKFPNNDKFRKDSGIRITLQMVKDSISMMTTAFGFEEKVRNEIVGHYTQKLTDKSDQEVLRNAAVNVNGDFNIVCPTQFFAQQFALNAPLSHYYSYRLVQPLSNGIDWCPPWMGVCHAVDIEFLFGRPIAGLVNKTKNGNYNYNDYQLSLDMIRAWTNFAKVGNPGKMGSDVVEWEEAFGSGNSGLESHKMMELNSSHYWIVKGYFQNVCDNFWRSRIFV